MLALGRKKDQEIWIDEKIRIKVQSIKGSRVVLLFDAPDEIRIRRAEIELKDEWGK